ncbi:MAG: hypothetical protein V4659_03960 [Pseudomonadota bacterium]
MTETAEQIAARLGLPLAPGAAVTRVAVRASAYVWDPETCRYMLARDVGKTVEEKRRDAKEAGIKAFWAGKRAARKAQGEVTKIEARAQETAARIETIRSMLSLGHSRANIAAQLGITMIALARRAHIAGITLPPADRPAKAARKIAAAKPARAPRIAKVKPVRAPRVATVKPVRVVLPYDERPEVLARRARVKAAWRPGAIYRDMIAELHIASGTLRRDLNALGIEADRAAGAKANAAGHAARNAAKVAQILPLLQAGMTVAAIALQMGERSDIVWKLLHRSGVAIPSTARQDPKVPKPSAEEIARRGDLIAAAHAEGLSVAGIQRRTGFAPNTIRGYLVARGLTTSSDPAAQAEASRIRNRAAREARVAAIVAAHEAGKDVAAIAKSLDLARSTVATALRASGIKPRRPAAPTKKVIGAQVVARRKVIARLYRSGDSLAAIMRATGATRGTVCADITALRAEGLRPQRAERVARINDPQFCAALFKARASGATVRDIAQTLKCSAATVLRALNACKTEPDQPMERAA